MVLKVDEVSEESRTDADSQYSSNDGDGLPPTKGNPCKNQDHAASEKSNVGNVANHEYFSKNVESKSNTISSDTSSGFNGVGPPSIICLHKTVGSSIGGSSEICGKIYSESEQETDKNGPDPQANAIHCSGKNKEAVVPDDGAELDMPEPPLQSISGDESDDSDIVEHDVKVCDICGDAGREDLLAVCSRCSDGAEHTYCMQEKLEEVPDDGDEWLCDECKLEEKSNRQKIHNAEVVNASEKNQSPEITDLFSKLEGKNEGAKITKKARSSMDISRKRPLNNTDGDSAVKRQALDRSAGSPRLSSPNRRTGPSSNSAFKNLDKGKVKLAHQLSLGASSNPRFQNIRGNILKSNSFNSIGNKPRVQPTDHVLPPKQKVAGEVGSYASKEGPVKMLNKSGSFKTANSSRSNAPESKVKMLSPGFPHFQDIKGPRKARERNTFERKNLTKLDVPMASLGKTVSTVSPQKGDHKLPRRGEIMLHPLPANIKGLNPVNSDGKSNSSKSIGSMSHKALDIAGEEENGPSFSPNAIGASSNNGIFGPEEQCNVVSPRANPAEKLSTPANDVGASTTRSSVEAVDAGNNLKAAIHAAMLKKPGIYRKRKVPDQSDDSSMSTTDLNCKAASKEQSSVSGDFRSRIFGKQEGLSVFTGNTSDSCKQRGSNVNQVILQSTESTYSLKTRESGSNIPSDAKPTRELSSPASVLSITLQKSAIPDHIFVWMGDFEIHRSGKVQELCGGMQAHLSTCASPRVLDVVNKFAYRVPLTEVSRSSTWPTQFHECGPREDHIALFFFANDVVSYERNYRSLLERMMKNDIALKGDIDGVELLIFPSNQLPKKFQRWNMLFFLWGVFRASKVHFSETKPNFSKKLNVSNIKEIALETQKSSADISLSGDLCLPGRIDEESSGCARTTNEVVASQEANGHENVLDRPNDTDELKLEKIVKDEGSDVKNSYDSNINTKDPRKRPEFDLMETASEAISRKREENISPKHTIESNGLFPKNYCTKYNVTDSMFFPERHGEQKSDKTNDAVKITEGTDCSEMHLLPVESLTVNEIRIGDEGRLPAGLSNCRHDEIPNLNLALADETESSTEQTIQPFSGGTMDKRKEPEVDKLTDALITNEEANDVSASLSLSLSFPFA